MAEKWVKNLAVASFLAFSIYLGFGLILPLFPKYVELLNGGGFEVGVLLASFMFTRAFLARPFGKLSDRIGRKKVIVTGMFLYGILAYLFTLPDHWSGLFLVRILQGTASAMVWPVGEALVVDSAPKEKRSRAISVYIFLTNIGIVAGPLIGAGILSFSKHVLKLSELTTIRTPFYFTSAIAFAGAVVGLIFLRDILPPIKDRSKMVKEEKKALKLIRPIIRRSLYILYSNSFFEGLSWSLGSVVMFFFMQRNYGMDEIVFSALFGIAQGLGLVLVVPSGVLSDRTKKKPFVVWGSLGSRISTLIMAFTPAFPLGKWLAMVFYSGKDMGRQVAMPATRALQADLVPEKIRGKLIGTIQAWSNVGAVLGPIAGGFIWDITNGRFYDIGFMNLPGDTIAFLLSAFMGIIAALLVQRYVYEPPKGRSIG
jgi:MFS family permease